MTQSDEAVRRFVERAMAVRNGLYPLCSCIHCKHLMLAAQLSEHRCHDTSWRRGVSAMDILEGLK